MLDIAFEKMESYKIDESGKYRVGLIGTINGEKVLFPYLLSSQLYYFENRDTILSGLFTQSALRLVNKITGKENI